MLVKVVKIGNSKGVRLPKAVIQACDLKEEVEMSVQEGRVVIEPIGLNRRAWAESFQSDLLEKPIQDKKEWLW